MSFEHITEIEVIGRPTIKVPSGMTAESTMRAMSIDPSDYEQTVNGSKLILAAQSGSKGLLSVRVLEDGTVVPYGNPTGFPTDKDIEHLVELFPNDNLFETLNQPEKLATYAKALVEAKDELEKSKDDKLIAERKELVENLKDVATRALPFITNLESLFGAQLTLEVAQLVEKLEVLVSSAEAEAVSKLLAEEAARKEQELLEQVRSSNA